jgi:hypothetical protein
MVLNMKNNNYASMCTFLVTGLFVCTCAVAQAQAPADESSQFSSSTPSAGLESTRFDTENPQQVDATPQGVAQYALLVKTLESDFGPFDARLSEPLLSTGDMLAERGDFNGAVSYTERALHIVRINQGLYSEPQIPIVERLIEFNVAVENWEAVDENFRYLEFLYSRLFDVGSLKWDYGIAQVADWHVIAINNRLGDDLENHLRAANKLFKLRLVYAEQDENVDQRVIDVLRHNVEYTAIHLHRQQDEVKTQRTYTRLDTRYRDDRADSLASID